MTETTHLPGCHWQRTLPTECEWRDTHHYCPHPNHACTCAELALIDVYEHGPAAASPPPSPNARCDWHFEVDALTEERCAFAKGHDGRHSYERAAASPVPVGTPSGLSIGGFDLSPVGTPAPTLTPEITANLAAECDRVGGLWEHVQERMQEAQAALHVVGPPYSPETTNPLYYPLLFLLKSVEAYHRDEE